MQNFFIAVAIAVAIVLASGGVQNSSSQIVNVGNTIVDDLNGLIR